MAELKWYLYRQNNSGGYFIRNERVGDNVFIQAHSEEESEDILGRVVENDSAFCNCCGIRWAHRADVVISPEHGICTMLVDEDSTAVAYFHDGDVKQYKFAEAMKSFFYEESPDG